MERYSLLKLHPALFTRSSSQSKSPLSPSSLYKLLDGAVNGVQGKKVAALDGLLRREYTVEKYERYKVTKSANAGFVC